MEDVLVRPSKKGQMRILEAVIATTILLVAFTAFYFMLYSSEKFFKQEAVDLNRLSYNALMYLVESEVVERALGSGAQAGEAMLVKTLQSILPSNVFFNLTVINVTEASSKNTVMSMSNAVSAVFERSGEVASAKAIYTSSRGSVYELILKLAVAGAT